MFMWRLVYYVNPWFALAGTVGALGYGAVRLVRWLNEPAEVRVTTTDIVDHFNREYPHLAIEGENVTREQLAKLIDFFDANYRQVDE